MAITMMFQDSHFRGKWEVLHGVNDVEFAQVVIDKINGLLLEVANKNSLNHAEEHERVQLEQLKRKLILEQEQEKARLEELKRKLILEQEQEKALLDELKRKLILEQEQEKARLDELKHKQRLDWEQRQEKRRQIVKEEKGNFKYNQIREHKQENIMNMDLKRRKVVRMREVKTTPLQECQIVLEHVVRLVGDNSERLKKKATKKVDKVAKKVQFGAAKVIVVPLAYTKEVRAMLDRRADRERRLSYAKEMMELENSRKNKCMERENSRKKKCISGI